MVPGFGAGMATTAGSVFAAGMGGGLAAGMQAASATPFMHDDSAHDDLFGDEALGLHPMASAPSSNLPQALPQVMLGSGELYSPTMAAEQRQQQRQLQQTPPGSQLQHARQVSAELPHSVVDSEEAVAPAAAEQKRLQPSVRFADDGHGSIAHAAVHACGRPVSKVSPKTPEQSAEQSPQPPANEQMPPPLPSLQPQSSVEQQPSGSLPHSLVERAVTDRVSCSKLIPSLSGLCDWINKSGGTMKNLRVHMDFTSWSSKQDKVILERTGR